MRRSLSEVRLKHLNRAGYFRSGNPRYYFRPKGEKGKALPDLPTDHPKWNDEYNRLYQERFGERPRSRVSVGTIARAIQAYKASDMWLDLAESTRGNRYKKLDDILARYGSGNLSDLRADHIERDLKEFNGNPANARLKVWRGLCAFLYDDADNRLRPNPALQVKKRKVPKSKGHIAVSREEVEIFRSFWPYGTPQRTAFEIINWTGARVSDAVELSEGSIKRGWLEFTQKKTGDEVSIPWDTELPNFAWNNPNMIEDYDQLTRALSARKDRHFMFITTFYGKKRSRKAASSWMANAFLEAGIKNRSAHGLRKARAIELAYAGASNKQIGAWTGHNSSKEIDYYTKQAKKKMLLMNRKKQESSNF